LTSAVIVRAAAIVCLSAAPGKDLGRAVYVARCSTCHRLEGEGTPGTAPPLRGMLGRYVVNGEGRDFLASIVVWGMIGPIESGGKRYNAVMPPFATLDDESLAAVLRYVLTTLNGRSAAPPAFVPTAADIRARRQTAGSAAAVRRMRLKLLEDG